MTISAEELADAIVLLTDKVMLRDPTPPDKLPSAMPTSIAGRARLKQARLLLEEFEITRRSK